MAGYTRRSGAGDRRRRLAGNLARRRVLDVTIPHEFAYLN